MVDRILNLSKNFKMTYLMKVYSIHFDEGKTEWGVEYPDLKG